MTGLFLLPDYLYQFINCSFVCSDKPSVLKLLFPLSLGLLINPYKAITFSCLGLLAILQLMQFAHLSYFGNYLSPYDFYLLFDEYQDVFQEVGNVCFRYWKVVLIVIIPFTFMFLLLTKVRTLKSKFGFLILLLTFGAAYYYNCFVRYNSPSAYRFSIDNSLKSFCSFLDSLYKGYHPKSYEPYVINKQPLTQQEPIFVVYILGESVNYNHMSLFGYDRNTTPKLKELSKQPNVYYTKGIAGGICTKASLKYMMNVIGEPDNSQLAYSDTTNLFRLAKENGFKTFYISAQLENLLSIISGKKYIDKLFTASRDENFDIYNEDYIISLLERQTFSNRNFVVLHQRCIHTPYSMYNPKSPDECKFSGSDNPVIDDYDNAMLYNDQIVTRLFNYFNKQKTGKFYIIWISDHNELLGENGLFGHGHLIKEGASTPVIIQTNDDYFLNEIKKIYKPSQYEITKSIAKILGHDIINPNSDGKTFYISGVDFNGKYGYIKYKKDSGKKEVVYSNEK